MPSPTDPVLLAAAIAAAFVTVLSSLGGMIVLIINANSAAKDRREAAAERKVVLDATTQAVKAGESNGKKADAIIEATGKIHELTNSQNSNLQKSLEVLTEKYAGLEKLLEQMKEEKRTTAAVRAVTDLQAAAALVKPRPADALTRSTDGTVPLAVEVVNTTDAPVPVLPKVP